MAILATPYLPRGEVKTVLLSCMAVEAKRTLENSGIRVLLTENNPLLPYPVAHHPDMSFLHLGDFRCLVLGQDILKKQLQQIGFCVLEPENEYARQYPCDIGLNCAIIGETVVGRLPFSERRIRRELPQYTYIDVAQGYTKCSICMVDHHSLITEDESIYRALHKRFDVLKIQSDVVRLDGYSCGFFGGCCGLIGKQLLGVNGELKHHPDALKIKAFLKERHVEVLELKLGDLVDIGSVIPLEENL